MRNEGDDIYYMSCRVEHFHKLTKAVQEETNHYSNKIPAQRLDCCRNGLHFNYLRCYQKCHAQRRNPGKVSNYIRWILAILQMHYQITQDVIVIIASLSVVKKSCSSWPFSRIRPIVVPKITLNMTRPRTLEPSRCAALNSQFSMGSVWSMWYTLILHTINRSRNLFTYVLAKCWCSQKSPCGAEKVKVFINTIQKRCP